MVYRLKNLWPFWRSNHILSPFPLLFAPSLTDIREWKVEIDPSGAVLKNPLPTDGILKVKLHRILIETGIAMTLATSSWDPRSWYALYRYGADFSGTAPKLRFFSGILDKDPRLIAIASEEIAMGITCYILREHFGLDHITDAYACIQNGELHYVNLPSEHRPDYFCVDTAHETVIAESKGATGTRSEISKKIDPEGLVQVQNVAPVNLSLRNSCGRVVIGTHFCIDGMHPLSETTTIIKDPKGAKGLEENPDSDMAIRLAYAKSLRFMGQEILAEYLIMKRDFPELLSDIIDSDLPRINNLPILPLGLTPFGDEIGLYGATAKAIFTSTAQSMGGAIRESLSDFRDRRASLESTGYALPNGVIIVYEYDEIK